MSCNWLRPHAFKLAAAKKKFGMSIATYPVGQAVPTSIEDKSKKNEEILTANLHV